MHRIVSFSGLLVLSTLSTVVLGASPYRGPGGQIEAAGIIAGVYMLTATSIEECAKHPQLKTRATRSLREYLNKNQQTYMDVMRKLPELAYANGGNTEVQRLKRELETALTQLESQVNEKARSQAQSFARCKAYLDTVDKGMLDLKVNNNNELSRILN